MHFVYIKSTKLNPILNFVQLIFNFIIKNFKKNINSKKNQYLSLNF